MYHPGIFGWRCLVVKCVDCGFLAVRHRESRELCSAELDYREHGRIPNLQPSSGTGYQMYEEAPLCFQRIVAFRTSECSSPEARVAVLQEERGDCEGFTVWQQGFTPKEHREMLDRMWMAEREDSRDAVLRASEDRRYRQMVEREDRRDENTQRLQERLHNRELWFLGVAVTVALVGGSIIAAIIEGAISRGWQPSWWPF